MKLEAWSLKLVMAIWLLSWPTSCGWAFGFLEEATQWEPGKPIEFVINMTHVPATFTQEQYVEYVRKALEPWKRVATANLPFTIGPIINDSTKTQPQGDGTNMIFWQPGFIPKDMFAGKAYPFASECDILLAPRPPFTLVDIQAIVMHELGHCMGLAHSAAPGVMTKFSGLPSLGYDDHVAVSLLYPNRKDTLEETTATISGRVVDGDGDPVVAAVLWVLDGQTGRILTAGFSGLVKAQRRKDASGKFELPGIPPGRHRLQIQPMDAFAAADPEGYGAPAGAPLSFRPNRLDLPELSAGDSHDVGTISLED